MSTESDAGAPLSLCVVQYDRSSLADADRQDVAPARLEQAISAGSGLAVPLEQMRRGKLRDLDQVRRLIGAAAGGPEVSAEAMVMLCPALARAGVEDGKQRQTGKIFVVPIWVPALLRADGSLLAPGTLIPFVPRDLLEPLVREGGVVGNVVLGTADTLDRYLTSVEAPRAGSAWVRYWQFAMDMARAVSRGADTPWNFDAEAFDLGDAGLDPQGRYRTVPGSFVLPDAGTTATTRAMLGVLDYLVEQQSVLPMVARYNSLEPAGKALPMNGTELVRASALHVAQMGDVHGLASSQRLVVIHSVSMDPYEVLAVNGPAGTGKTTVLLSVFASNWVWAAYQGGEPPIQAAVSANNQAVTNVIEALGKAEEREQGVLRGRWLPGVTSYGLYLPAQSLREAAIADGFQAAGRWGEGFPQVIESPESVERAREHFTRCGAAYLGRPTATVQEVVERLHADLRRTVAQIQDGATRKAAVIGSRQEAARRFGSTGAVADAALAGSRAVSAASCAVAAEVARADAEGTQAAEAARAEIARVKETAGVELAEIRELRIQWEAHVSRRPWWMVVLSGFAAVGQQIEARTRLHFSSVNLPLDRFTDDSVAEMFERAIRGVEKREAEAVRASEEVFRQRMDAIRSAHEVAVLPLRDCMAEAEQAFSEVGQVSGRVAKAEAAWAEWLQAHDLTETPGETALADGVDATLRFRAFKLATHYWEGRWLLDMSDLPRHTDVSGREGRGREAQLRRYRRYAKLTPCFVSTLHTLPGVLRAHEGGRDGRQVPLQEMVDLLVIDEAGQVSPETATASIALARRVLVVGDTEQLQPVHGVGGWVDNGNLFRAGVATTDEARASFHLLGRSAATGSVMRVAQAQSRFQDPDYWHGGLLLREHWRSAPEIIGFPNELCYGSLLRPMRPTLAEIQAQRPWFNLQLPRIGYGYIPGKSRQVGGSRANEEEARVIAAWIAANVDLLRAVSPSRPGCPLEEAVAVITPFTAQARDIQERLEQMDRKGRLPGLTPGKRITVGTVHSLQGAERPVVILSPVYAAGEETFMLDSTKYLLNTVVTRAMESMLVFGAMENFDPGKTHCPTGRLARWLYARAENRIDLDDHWLGGR